LAAIRQQINIAVPVRTVWSALTTDRGIASWWGRGGRIEAREGGRVVLVQENAAGEPVELRGMLHEFRPTRRIEIAWDSVGSAPAKGTRVAFQLARDGEETRVSVVHSGAGVLDDEAGRAKLDEEWKKALMRLRTTLEGE
jgi:uncharacterized protein YndB with AHSA1/START domain